MSGGCLLVSNHLSYADPVFIGAAFPRKIRYLAYTGLEKSRIMRLVFKLTETLTVSQERSLASIKKSVRKLNSGSPSLCLCRGRYFQTRNSFALYEVINSAGSTSKCSDYRFIWMESGDQYSV